MSTKPDTMLERIKCMQQRCCQLNNSDGSVMVVTLLLLVVLTIIGVSSITTSNIEVQVATNDKVHKMAFYAADGGCELGTELLELNIACSSGFANDNLVIGNITVIDKDFWMQGSEPQDGSHDVQIDAASGPHTNLSIFGTSAFGVGGAIEMAAGYEGKGKAAASGGVSLLYEIHSQHLGLANSESVVAIQWRHNIGLEGACMY